jgi:hypothetical protein
VRIVFDLIRRWTWPVLSSVPAMATQPSVITCESRQGVPDGKELE